MSRIEIRDLAKGRLFFEVEGRLASAWIALEDARWEDKRRCWVCYCLRSDGNKIEFSSESAPNQKRLDLRVEVPQDCKVLKWQRSLQ